MQKLMAANWKMYKTAAEAAATLMEFQRYVPGLPEDREVVFFAPFTALATSAEILAKMKARVYLGAQDVYPAAEGAFTGEISPNMLKESACRFVLTGHSERRQVLGENDVLVGRKTCFVLESGLDALLCIGETLEEREKGALEQVLRRQLEAGLRDVPSGVEPQRLVVAYEPVWAIGTGKVAGPSEILEAHALIREILRAVRGAQASDMRILYGGSVKAENAGEIIALDNVDGVLVGGASLQAETFSRIVLA